MAPNDHEPVDNHPNASITQRNLNMSGFLKNIPQEIRFDIYEYAVYVDKPIVPKQVVARSNKFVWRSHTTERKHGNDTALEDKDNHRILKSTEDPLVVTQLARTCRTIYFEVEAVPVFYRINHFRLNGHRWQNEALRFLTAITPARRSLIRYATVFCAPEPFFWSDTWRKSFLAFPLTRNWGHIFTLICQCDNLQRLVISVNLTKAGTYYPQAFAREMNRSLELCLESARSADETRSCWSLPSFELTLTIGDLTINLMNTEPIDPVLAPNSCVHKDPLAKLITEVKHLAASRKLRLTQKDGQAKIMAAQVTGIQLQDAVSASQQDSNIGCEVGSSWETLDSIMTKIGLCRLEGFYRFLVNLPLCALASSYKLEDLQAIPEPKEIPKLADAIMLHLKYEKPRSWKFYVKTWATLQSRFEARVARLAQYEEREARKAAAAAKLRSLREERQRQRLRRLRRPRVLSDTE
ncbi:Uu.00g114460.m01.CDS01 [Anthostomella pinea]|uniref:Uu.00g114460.m01.CDS01 n=1 Tax=Anthostomella pinea TaxID=933095 RepID=A0AAI8YGS7_9PEZI|nr:Uu.00g114460.m01.CDS01 [Anthostomella pinea]